MRICFKLDFTIVVPPAGQMVFDSHSLFACRGIAFEGESGAVFENAQVQEDDHNPLQSLIEIFQFVLRLSGVMSFVDKDHDGDHIAAEVFQNRVAVVASQIGSHLVDQHQQIVGSFIDWEIIVFSGQR